MKLYIFRAVHHQEFIHCTLSNGICHTAFEQHYKEICYDARLHERQRFVFPAMSGKMFQ
jgi:hypothetical protein